MTTNSIAPAAASTRAHNRFYLDCLWYLLRGGLRLPGGHRAQPGSQVPAEFAGVCVASQDDPEADAAMLDYLRALGIQHVRMDFTYHSLGGHGERFLERLLDEGMQVLLRLLPPLEEANRMAEPEAQQHWSDFVASVIERFGSRLEAVEVGNVINRRRWSGYRKVDDFLVVWELAWRQLRERGITLAGPNVTDFEPPYNYAFLRAMQRRGQLPDIHTNNLFVERCTQPEVFDHAVAGYLLAPVLKLNLIKKARVLHRVSEHFGINRTYSTTAFWTLPRIGRRLPDSEEKQADYLARYMVLAAASGNLERAYWGPLVSQREGLVDDGTGQPASHELVGQYTENSGCWTRYVQRPSFAAMATFNRLIPGSRYQGEVVTCDNLHLHRFTTESHTMHVLWTTNTHAAVLAQLYSPSDLQQAEIITHLGETLTNQPALAIEEPLYLRWPADRQVPVNSGIEVMSDVAVYSNRAGGRDYYYRDDTWHGMVFAASQDEADQLLEVLHPDKVAPPAGDNTLRKSRNVIWSIQNPLNPDRKLAIKKPNRLSWNKKIVDYFKPTKAVRSWNGASRLLRMGIDSPAPVAWFERHTHKDTLNSWYVCEHAGAIPSVRDFFQHYAAGENEHLGISRDRFFRALCDFLLKMHNRGVYFRDLTGGNILVKLDSDKPGSEQTPQFSLIDTARARFYDRGASLTERLSDLKRTCYKLDWSGRDAFMSLYLESIGRSFNWLYRIPFYYFDWKMDTKRAIKRKKKRKQKRTAADS